MEKLLSRLKKNSSLLPLKSIRQGVERECLRINSEAEIASSDHPKGLGSKLTHPFITTDYSENLLEYITVVYESEEELLDELLKMHSFTYKKLEHNESIWPMSMPAVVPIDESLIKVANYGSSNIGKLKELYRVGLGYRYGKSMQSIAGVHYNFSLDDKFWKSYGEIQQLEAPLAEIKNEGYFHLIRNYRRYSSLLVYLFGATPLVDESFLNNKKHKLEKLGRKTWGKKKATSLRMGGLGYTSSAQDEISICYNALETYIETLESARLKSYKKYEEIGVKDEKGFKQLNTNLLQIDNEFYSTIRPKNIARTGESALGALFKRGIEYIEVRLLDVNPFNPVGIDKQTIRFLHAFLLFCLFEDSPLILNDECVEIDKNFSLAVNEGLDENLFLFRNAKKESKKEFFGPIIKGITEVATLLDSAYGVHHYSEAVSLEALKVNNISLLPSYKVMSLVDEKKSLVESMHEISLSYKTEGLTMETDPEWDEVAERSLSDQKALECDDEKFESFLERYFTEIKINFQDGNA